MLLNILSVQDENHIFDDPIQILREESQQLQPQQQQQQQSQYPPKEGSPRGSQRSISPALTTGSISPRIDPSHSLFSPPPHPMNGGQKLLINHHHLLSIVMNQFISI